MALSVTHCDWASSSGMPGPTKSLYIGEELVWIDAFRLAQPIVVRVQVIGLVRIGEVAPVKDAVPVVHPRLARLGARDVKLADERAVVTGIGQDLGYEYLIRRKVRRAVAVDVVRRAVTASEKADATGRAHGALGVCAGERDALAHERVEIGRADVRIAQRVDGVVALRVGAVPQDVRPLAPAHGEVSLIGVGADAARRRAAEATPATSRLGTRCLANTSSMVSRSLITSASAPLTRTVAGRATPLNYVDVDFAYILLLRMATRSAAIQVRHWPIGRQGRIDACRPRPCGRPAEAPGRRCAPLAMRTHRGAARASPDDFGRPSYVSRNRDRGYSPQPGTNVAVSTERRRIAVAATMLLTEPFVSTRIALLVLASTLTRTSPSPRLTAPTVVSGPAAFPTM